VALFGAAALVAGVGGAAAARSTNPLHLKVSPQEQLVNLGGTATYALSLDQTRNFTGTAALSIVSGLPKHSSAAFSSNTISGNQQVTLTVQTNSQTRTGPDDIRIKAKSQGHTETITARLWVVLIPLSISASPAADTINAGQSAVYNVKIRHGRWDPKVKLSVSGLPAGATASFSPSSTTGTSSKLTVKTNAASTPSGDFTLTIRAYTSLRSATAQVVLRVGPVGRPFTITGSLDGTLLPGTGGGVDVTLHNPNSVPITVSGVVASVSSVTAPNATASLPCTDADFSPVAMLGTVVVPAGATETLSQLGMTAANFPQLNMINSSTSQDGCSGASLGLTWTGTATGGN
jgi:hypothetical protein